MFNSLKKWVQDKAVDLTPPTTPSQPSRSSSSLSSKSGSLTQNYYYSTTPSYEQKYHERLSRPISMDSMRSSKMVSTTTSAIPPVLTSPAELDLSHLNREEQEHIANVLRRARAIDEQQSTKPAIAVPFKQSPAASIVSASLSPSASSSSSSSTSTSSFNSERPEKYDQYEKNDNHDENEIRTNAEFPTSLFPESTLITIHRCQVCNKEQQNQGNPAICPQCQENEEIARITENNSVPQFAPIDKISSSSSSSSPQTMESNDREDDQIYDNVIQIDQELIKANSPIEENASYLLDQQTEIMNDHQGREEKQVRQSPPIPSFGNIRSKNLTEIDEDDFFYQGPSPYVTTNSPPEQLDEPVLPSYQIDEDIDEDEIDERDHVKELEETIANISRHFPVSSDQLNDTELNSIETNFHPPSNSSIGKIDIDSILEMEIESPSIDEQKSIHLPLVSSQPPLNIPISIPISVNNRRASLSRSSGVRENLTDLLVTTTIEPYPIDEQPLHRTASIHSKRVIPIHRQRRNLPTVPTMMNRLQLRRANSESRFSLPAVPTPIITSNSNLDDESDLLEIDLNDPTGLTKRTARSKTESEMPNSDDLDYHYQSSLIEQLLSTKKPTKQLRDQTTNTPPISTTKPKKKLKKKTASPPMNTNEPLSPTRTNAPINITSSTSTTNTNRAKLQKSTSTEISYPFPVLKLILSRDNLNPSRRAGTDLGLRISGGLSLSNCMEVTACIDYIDSHHRNYNILKNAVQEGDEVLEVGGVSLRGKSALFVQNLINSIENEFEIVVRSQQTLPPTFPPIGIHKPDKPQSTNQSNHSLTVSSLTVDPNIQRRHSMDTTRNHTNNNNNNNNNNIVVKSKSTIMPLPFSNTSYATEQLLSPTVNRKKSVSSKERLFSVESLNRASSVKSNEHLIKVATSTAPEIYSSKPTTTLSITTPNNKILNAGLITSSQPLQRRRIYEHRNSLLPNDPGLHASGSNASIERRSSNESDESDNLSQYFRSTSSRKSSLINPNDAIHNTNLVSSHERSQSAAPIDPNVNNDATRRLQNFIKTNDEKRTSTSSAGHDSNKTMERKSSGVGSFKFLKKKTKSVEFSNKSSDVRENDYVGDIELQIGHNSEREQLVVRIIKARNLPAKDTNGYSDPFVKVYLLPGRDQENKRRTKHISRNLNPCWDHTVVYGNMHREELQYKMLEFTVWDYDRFKANDFIGQITIDLKDTRVIDDKSHWYRLQALRSRDEASNRGSSPRLFQMTSVDSTSTSTPTSTRTTVNTQSRVNQRK